MIENYENKNGVSNEIEKRVRGAARETLKRELKQTRQLQKYLEEVNKTPRFSNEKIIGLWQDLGDKIKNGNAKELLKTEKKVFKANLRELISITKNIRKEQYIKPYFTSFELIKIGEKGLWNAIHNYKWPQKWVSHKTSIAHSAINRQILETSERKRYKVVTGENYNGKQDLISITYAGHPILDNSSLTFTERMIADKKFRDTLKRIKEFKKNPPKV
ncbi:hypothetical protein KKE19_00485 [Patescibacteria group bacterium]|nr:hypothetical protein [Patescibacteria group bacterium]MBU4367617.1 hypothetical protein [Patescibacteria group bacterium]MBU4462097.1 hypothetical protein [Patescibacteria group bacterium]MCG2700416.1 hypothetical protein [Candidatus Parcubacteria bacterium]